MQQIKTKQRTMKEYSQHDTPKASTANIRLSLQFLALVQSYFRLTLCRGVKLLSLTFIRYNSLQKSNL